MGVKRKKKRVVLYRLAAAAFAVLLVVSTAMFVRELWLSKKEAQTFSDLAALRQPRGSGSFDASAKPAEGPASTSSPAQAPKTIKIEDATNPAAPFTTEAPTTEGDATEGEPGKEDPTEGEPGEETPTGEQPAEGPSGEPTPLERYLPLYELNHDFFAWITMEDTRIDYPVMYNAKDPLAYLGHDFYGKFSYAGVPFLDSDCDPNGDYYIVYGHRMNDGSMFADLVKYEDPAFWEAHPTFTFDTLYEERTYAVMMAIRARVLRKDEKYGFRYYKYTSLDSEGEFEEFMEQAREASLYDTGVEAAYGDELLVLSTCYHYTNNGRFVLIAKRVF